MPSKPDFAKSIELDEKVPEFPYNTEWRTFTMNRILYTLLAAAALGLAGCTACTPKQEDKTAETDKHKLSAITLSSEFHTAKVDEEINIAVKTTPAGTELKQEDFEASGGTLTVDGATVKFKAAEAGNYTIKATKDKITSNTLTIEIVAGEDTEQADGGQQAPAADQGTAYVDPGTQGVQQPAADASAGTQTPADNTQNSGSQGDGSQNTDSQPATPSVLTVKQVLSNPAKYDGQTITVQGSLPQAAVTGPDGQPATVIYPAAGDTSQRLYLSGLKLDFGGCDAKLTGVMKQGANGIWTLDVTSAEQTGPSGVAGDQTGKPVSELPKSGTFHFTVDRVRIRYGTDGLKSQESGKYFNKGDSVKYNKVYEKDGYTWISYKAYSGKTCSVAVGDTKTVQYGWAD